MMRNTFYARNRGSGLWRRWLIDHAGLSMVRNFDKTGRLPPDGIILRLIAPTGVRRLNYTRSKAFKVKRAESKMRREGKSRRKYRNDPLPEVRWGSRKKAA